MLNQRMIGNVKRMKEDEEDEKDEKITFSIVRENLI